MPPQRKRKACGSLVNGNNKASTGLQLIFNEGESVTEAARKNNFLDLSAAVRKKMNTINRIKKEIEEKIKSGEIEESRIAKAKELSLKQSIHHSISIESVPVNDKTISQTIAATEYLAKINYEELTMEDIHTAHRILKPHKKGLGKFRTCDVVVETGSSNFQSGVIPFEGLPQKMEKFVKWARNLYKEEEIPVVLKAALIKLIFVIYHPYKDGNGRISRMLLNGILNSHDYPMITLPEKTIQQYYSAIHNAQKGNLHPYYHYIFDCIINSMKSYSNNL